MQKPRVLFAQGDFEESQTMQKEHRTSPAAFCVCKRGSAAAIVRKTFWTKPSLDAADHQRYVQLAEVACDEFSESALGKTSIWFAGGRSWRRKYVRDLLWSQMRCCRSKNGRYKSENFFRELVGKEKSIDLRFRNAWEVAQKSCQQDWKAFRSRSLQTSELLMRYKSRFSEELKNSKQRDGFHRVADHSSGAQDICSCVKYKKKVG